MEILKNFIEPSYSRKPFHHSYELADYIYSCPQCSNQNTISFSTILKSAYSWFNTYTPEEVKNIEQHFGIGLVGKSHDGGMPSISSTNCEKCQSNFISYLGLMETSNSVYRITEQGLSSIKNSH